MYINESEAGIERGPLGVGGKREIEAQLMPLDLLIS